MLYVVFFQSTAVSITFVWYVYDLLPSVGDILLFFFVFPFDLAAYHKGMAIFLGFRLSGDVLWVITVEAHHVAHCRNAKKKSNY